jgi:hypothetical protein
LYNLSDFYQRHPNHLKKQALAGQQLLAGIFFILTFSVLCLQTIHHTAE